MLSCILCIFQTSFSASSSSQLLWYSGPCLLHVHQSRHHLPSIVTWRCFTLSPIFTEMLSYLLFVDIKDDDFIVQIHLALVSLSDTSPLAVFIRMGTAEATSCYYDFKQPLQPQIWNGHSKTQKTSITSNKRTLLSEANWRERTYWRSLPSLVAGQNILQDWVLRQRPKRTQPTPRPLRC